MKPSTLRYSLGNVFYPVAVAFVFALCLALPGMASTITVTDTSDSSPSSLRAAIASASSGDTINFSLPNPSTITLSSGPLTISTSLTIRGPGASSLFISGNNAVQVFSISSGVTATISGVTIENGIACFGGGIFNSGTLTVTNSTLSRNSSSCNTMPPNSSFYGGGIFNYFATLTVTNSTLSGNYAGFDGGGIFNDGGTLTVTSSTLSGNSTNGGGGIYSDLGKVTNIPNQSAGNNNSAAVTVTNSTLSGNSATYAGGGILIYGGTLTVTNGTLSGTPSGTGIETVGGSVTMKNSIVSNNPFGENCVNAGGTLTSQGHNLSDDNSCSTFFNTGIGDVNSTPAGLDPSGLQNNGGPTQTIALLKTSLAVDAIPLTPINYCTDTSGNPVKTDQRGVTRPQGSGCDIGAFELMQSNFAILYEGAGGHNLQITNVTVQGNIGVGGTAAVQFSGPGTISGSLEFAAPNTGQFHNNNRANVGPSSVTYNNTPQDVVGGLTNLNSLSAMAGEAAGADVTINGTQTIQASDGMLETINGMSYRVFQVTSYQENDGKMLTINGDGNDVVFNFSNGLNLGGDVTLTGTGPGGVPLTPDMVLWNFVGNGNVQLNNNASSYPLPLAFQGIILAPNNAISLSNANLNGRVYGGDSRDMQIVSGTTINPMPPQPAPQCPAEPAAGSAALAAGSTAPAPCQAPAPSN